MRPIPAVSAAVALALVCATPAAAAPGVVRLFSPDGQSRIITNPSPTNATPASAPAAAC